MSRHVHMCMWQGITLRVAKLCVQPGPPGIYRCAMAIHHAVSRIVWHAALQTGWNFDDWKVRLGQNKGEQHIPSASHQLWEWLCLCCALVFKSFSDLQPHCMVPPAVSLQELRKNCKAGGRRGDTWASLRICVNHKGWESGLKWCC